jgi:hypothetical protein
MALAQLNTSILKRRVARARPALRATIHDRKGQRLISNLFEGINGYSFGPEEGRLRANRSHVYGELASKGLHRLLDHLQLNKSDVFYDLGSGIGRVLIQVAMEVPLKKCVGIEVANSRFLHAQTILDRVQKQKLLRAKQVELRNENFLESDLSDATVLYTCSTCFSGRLMNRLARKIAELNRDLILITFQKLSRRRKRLELVGTLNLDTSWRKDATVFVYQVSKPSSR